MNTLQDKDAVLSGRFVEERARGHLKQLTSVGSRPAGSYENEVLAVDFIKRTLEDIKGRAKPIHKVGATYSRWHPFRALFRE